MTENTKIRQEALTELARSDEHRSYTAQIRDLYDGIEQALKSGVSRTTIHQKLMETGMTISLRHFDQALYRIRKSKITTLPAKMTSGESGNDKSNKSVNSDVSVRSTAKDSLIQQPPQKTSAFAHLADLNPRKPGEYNPVPDEDRIYGRNPENTTKARIDFKKLNKDIMDNTDWEALKNGD